MLKSYFNSLISETRKQFQPERLKDLDGVTELKTSTFRSQTRFLWLELWCSYHTMNHTDASFRSGAQNILIHMKVQICYSGCPGISGWVRVQMMEASWG